MHLPKSLRTVNVGLARMGPLGAERLWWCDGVEDDDLLEDIDNLLLKG